jgi:2-polyprenyl-3-methyl-5-hydroxy-6-metoxy-1,4-benzoquinol methylase
VYRFDKKAIAALDLACGLGANALVLAKQGLTTEAWDISAIFIA